MLAQTTVYKLPVSVKKHFTGKKALEMLALKTPNQGVESSCCFQFARQRLAGKTTILFVRKGVFFHRHQYHVHKRRWLLLPLFAVFLGPLPLFNLLLVSSLSLEVLLLAFITNTVVLLSVCTPSMYLSCLHILPPFHLYFASTTPRSLLVALYCSWDSYRQGAYLWADRGRMKVQTGGWMDAWLDRWVV